MLYPPMSDLLKQIDSRARQISIEADQRQETLTDKPVTLAIKEVANGDLTASIKEEYLQ